MNEPGARAPANLRRIFALTRDQWTGLVFVQAWVFLLTIGSALFKDPGTFWHIIVGDRILAHGFPHQDWLSYTREGAPWIAHQWLAEVAMSALYRAAGFDGLLVAFTGLIALLVAFLFHRTLSAGVRPGWAALLTTTAALAMLHHLHARPHIVTMVLFAWTYGELVSFESGRVSVLRLSLLIPVFAVWTNVHGGILGGLASVGLAVAAWLLRAASRLAGPIARSSTAVGVIAVGIACCATVLINPYGVAMPRTWIAIMGSRPLARIMLEHQSFLASPAWLAIAIMAVYAVAFAVADWRHVRATSLVAAVWLVLGLERTRHLPLFAIAAVFSVPDLLRHARWRPALVRRARFISDAPPSGRDTGVTWPLLAVVCAVLIATLAQHHPVRRDSQPRFVTLEPRWPMKIQPELRRLTESAPQGAPILNDMLFGGFLAFYAPELRTFIDDRWELYGDRFVLEYVAGTAESYESWMQRYDPYLALAEPRSRLDVHLFHDRRWERVALDDAAALYRRRAASPPLPNSDGSGGGARSEWRRVQFGPRRKTPTWVPASRR